MDIKKIFTYTKLLLLWALIVFIFLVALGSMGNKNFIQTFLLVLVGIILLPKVNRIKIKKWEFKFTPAIKVILVIIVFIFVVATTKAPVKDRYNTNQDQGSVNTVVNEVSKSSVLITDNSVNIATSTQESANTTNSDNATRSTVFYRVVSVVDGDTIKVDINGKTESVRLIGIDTPETVDPRKVVQCFGKEASNKAKEWLSDKMVELEAEPSQGDRDTYNRLLRYVRVKDGIFYNLEIIKQGYAHEYTYNIPYKYQTDFKNAEKYARDNKLGLWADSTCAGDTSKPATASVVAPVAPINAPIINSSIDASKCLIKGNITAEKIYHLPGCGSYDKTVIDEGAGERWFCTETEAVAAGWRKAKNCP